LLLIVFSIFFLIESAISGGVPEGKEYNDPRNEWAVSAGMMSLYTPEYEGSDQYEIKVWPLIHINYQDRFFFDPGKGLGLYVLDRDGWRLGISAGYRFGRDQDDSEDLRGLGDVDGGITANLIAEWKEDNVSVNTRFKQQLSGDNTGFLIDLGAGYTFRIGKKLSFKPSVKTTYASNDYMDSFFSISNQQSKRSTLPVYEANSGFKSLGPRLFVLYLLDHNWSVQGTAEYDILIGDAKDSPIVKDKNQFKGGLGLSCRF
jgi:outer membrane scaffolding protein for murein synthesis (MipA/OmpV family)